MQKYAAVKNIYEYDAISIGNEQMDITLKSKFDLNRHKKAIMKKILKNIVERITDMEKEEGYINADEIIEDILIDIPSKEKIGTKIREARIRKRITQSNLCEQAGLTQPQLSAIENNKHIPSMETLKKIANALKVKINSFL